MYKKVWNYCIAALINTKKEKKYLSNAVTRIRTWVTSATTKGTNHYTITAIVLQLLEMLQIFYLNILEC